MITSDVNEIRRACDPICQYGQVYELRALASSRGTISGYFDNPIKLVAAAAQASDQLKAAGTYIHVESSAARPAVSIGEQAHYPPEAHDQRQGERRATMATNRRGPHTLGRHIKHLRRKLLQFLRHYTSNR